MSLPVPQPQRVPQRVLVLGATGTIGRATVQALLQRGHRVVCPVRARAGVRGALAPADSVRLLAHVGANSTVRATVRVCDVADAASLVRDGICGERFDALVSCLASRTGAPRDAWAIDHQAHVHALHAAQQAGVAHVVLLSALCVQKPLLAFQQAKLAFERVLIDCGTAYSIVRPTAFFKSLCGQVARVQRGKPYLLFGDGQATACKPISDRDLAAYLADCLDDPSRRNHVLPIGGPGPAITPRQQGEQLFALLGRTPRFRSVPVGVLDAVVGVLGAAGRLWPAAAAKAELARIGRYYATESMLVLDPASGRYDAAATPSTGHDTLFGCYAEMLRGAAAPERGDHAVF